MLCGCYIVFLKVLWKGQEKNLYMRSIGTMDPKDQLCTFLQRPRSIFIPSQRSSEYLKCNLLFCMFEQTFPHSGMELLIAFYLHTPFISIDRCCQSHCSLFPPYFGTNISCLVLISLHWVNSEVNSQVLIKHNYLLPMLYTYSNFAWSFQVNAKHFLVHKTRKISS